LGAGEHDWDRKCWGWWAARAGSEKRNRDEVGGVRARNKEVGAPTAQREPLGLGLAPALCPSRPSVVRSLRPPPPSPPAPQTAALWTHPLHCHVVRRAVVDALRFQLKPRRRRARARARAGRRGVLQHGEHGGADAVGRVVVRLEPAVWKLCLLEPARWVGAGSGLHHCCMGVGWCLPCRMQNKQRQDGCQVHLSLTAVSALLLNEIQPYSALPTWPLYKPQFRWAAPPSPPLCHRPAAYPWASSAGHSRPGG
jgi:hypothetical protein